MFTKRLTSIVLTLCLMFSVFALAPVEESFLSASAAVGVSVNGSSLSSANFIIDPGHGGNDPGAMSTVLGGNREEADDTLRLSLAVAKLINQSGASTALTRVTDITLSLQNRTDMANAGSYSYFVSIHRNACGTANLGTGIETYYHESQSASSPSAQLATNVQNALIGVGCWRNRGVKYNNFHVTRESNMPAILVECSFIDNATDNANFDTYFDADAKAIANGMLKMIGKSVVDQKTVTAPTFTSGSSVNYNTGVTFRWNAVTNATSYKYTVKLFDGEPSATSAVSTIYDSTTTATSINVPAQTKGKYLQATVTAVGPNNTATSTKLVALGNNPTYPTTVEYIPVNEINGATNVVNSIVVTSKTGSFAMTWWRAMLCSPNNDGTYTVKSVYEAGATKSVSVTGTNVVFAIHSSSTNYNYATKIAVGDKLSFVGVFIDNNVVYDNAHVLVNGGISLSVTAPTVSCPSEIEVGDTGTVSWATVTNATSYNYKVVLNNNGATSTLVEKSGVTDKSFTIPAVNEGTSLTVTVTAVGPVDSKTTTKTITLKVTAPTDITVSANDEIVKIGDSNAFRGFATLTTVQQTLDKFEQDNSFLAVYDAAGKEKSASDLIATGFTVNLVVNGKVTVTYSLVVAGDIDGDSSITATDYITQSKAMKSQTTLVGAYALAADVDGDGSLSTSDYIALAATLKS